jgi:hypothetical protein
MVVRYFDDRLIAFWASTSLEWRSPSIMLSCCDSGEFCKNSYPAGCSVSNVFQNKFRSRTLNGSGHCKSLCNVVLGVS